MKLGAFALTVMIAAGIGLAVGTALSQDKGEGGDQKPRDPAAEWAEGAKLQAPNEHHKRLQGMVGEWDVAGTFWMAGPGVPPTKTKGTATIESIFGGRYTLQRYETMFMGQPFNGISLDGYDNIKKKYVSLWIDSMSTGFFLGEGDYDAKTKTSTTHMTMLGKGGKEEKSRMVGTEKEDGSVVMESYVISDEGEFKHMELIYTRKK